MEGINLLNPSKAIGVVEVPRTEEDIVPIEKPKLKRPSLREIFQKESEKDS